MPHTLADVLFDHLIEVFPPDQAYGLAAFEREEMPPPIAHFLHIALQHGLGVEADAFLEVRSSWFDYDHPDVQEAFDLFIGVLGDHALVPASAWAETLAQAVAEVAEYLVQPVDTLVGFIFGQKKALPAYTVFSRFEYFAPYSYLHDVASAYAEEKGLNEIDRAHFRALLDKVDRQMTEDLDAAGWLDLLAPLYDLAERASGQASVPTPLLYTFFEVKGAEQVLERLEAERDTADVLSRGELRSLLEDALPSSASRSSAPVASAPEAARGADQPVPLWMQFQRHEHQRREALASPLPPSTPTASTANGSRRACLARPPVDAVPAAVRPERAVAGPDSPSNAASPRPPTRCGPATLRDVYAAPGVFARLLSRTTAAIGATAVRAAATRVAPACPAARAGLTPGSTTDFACNSSVAPALPGSTPCGYAASAARARRRTHRAGAHRARRVRRGAARAVHRAPFLGFARGLRRNPPAA